ncbi:DUF4349 domain-containing protein [Mucilaginibacter sp. KACC 22773]|uniref:DUF4349 domain-containing protein n=1 Tax=Mucilaginibacter sp. KACC 22773 TaxID=3025671 RepID=UPI0023667228|nr:DUF4349 domain-containing protein [Mucilaginibacter sp. KACC 22773]WDF77916.1 DUF4349 domain-containing protein [Mucilaginibacter sp. KACC 22773]
MKTYIITFSLLLTLCACEKKSEPSKLRALDVTLAAPPMAEEKNIGSANSLAKSASDKSVTPQKETIDTSKKIIKEGEIRFHTGNLYAAKQKIVNSLQSLGGYVAEETETNGGDNSQKGFDLKVRVPSKNFDRFLDALQASGDSIDTKNIRRKDVTSDFIDIATRLKNKQLLESRYLDLLRRATKTSDLLEIEDKIAEIRTDIESTQGQLNYMTRQVAFSSLDITFYNKHGERTTNENGFSYRFKQAITQSWDIVQDLFFTVITLWPVLVIVLIGFWWFRRWARKRKLEKDAE